MFNFFIITKRMKNFFKCVVLGLIAAVVPVCLTIFTLHIMPSQTVSISGGIILCLMACSTVYWFMSSGNGPCYNDEDSFWMSLFVCAAAGLGFNVGVFLWSWFGMGFTAFNQIPFAFAPVLLSVAYACMIGVIVFGMRLHYSGHNMTGTEIALSWSLIGILLFFMLGMLEEVGVRYFGLNLPGWLKTTIISAGVFSIVSMAFCAGKLIFKK